MNRSINLLAIIGGLSFVVIGIGGFWICVTGYMDDHDPKYAAAAVWYFATTGLGVIICFMPRLLRRI